MKVDAPEAQAQPENSELVRDGRQDASPHNRIKSRFHWYQHCTDIGVSPDFHNGVVKMEYLFVVVALASAGFVFAGLKKGIGRNEKKITRLEL